MTERILLADVGGTNVRFAVLADGAIGPIEHLAVAGYARFDEALATYLKDFTWKDLLDLYACAVCGRCHVNCPAQLSGKSLSPREVIHNLKEHLLEAGPGLLAGKAEASSENPA